MKRRSKQPQRQQVNASVQLEVRPDTPFYYVNFITVTHTAYDYTVTVAKVPSPTPPEQIEAVKAGKPILLEPTLQLVIPPLLMDGLIRALIDQKQRYEETVTLQVKNNELQRQQQSHSRGTGNAE